MDLDRRGGRGGRACGGAAERRARLLFAKSDAVGDDRKRELGLAHAAEGAAILAALVVDVLEVGLVGQDGGVLKVRRIGAVVARVMAVGGVAEVDDAFAAERIRDDARAVVLGRLGEALVLAGARWDGVAGDAPGVAAAGALVGQAVGVAWGGRRGATARHVLDAFDAPRVDAALGARHGGGAGRARPGGERKGGDSAGGRRANDVVGVA